MGDEFTRHLGVPILGELSEFDQSFGDFGFERVPKDAEAAL